MDSTTMLDDSTRNRVRFVRFQESAWTCPLPTWLSRRTVSPGDAPTSRDLASIGVLTCPTLQQAADRDVRLVALVAPPTWTGTSRVITTLRPPSAAALRSCQTDAGRTTATSASTATPRQVKGQSGFTASSMRLWSARSPMTITCTMSVRTRDAVTPVT